MAPDAENSRLRHIEAQKKDINYKKTYLQGLLMFIAVVLCYTSGTV